MSREKDTEDGDRRSLVEEGASCLPEKSSKETKEPAEAHWIHEPVVKTIVPVQTLRTTTAASGLPEVSNCRFSA